MRSKVIVYDRPTKSMRGVLGPGTYHPLAASGKVRCPITWESFYPTEWQGATQRNWETIDATVCTAPVNGYGSL